MDIVGKRRIFLKASLLITILSVLCIVVFGFRPSIEFTGGSRLELVSPKNIDVMKVENVLKRNNYTVVSVKKNNDKDITIRTDTISDKQKNDALKKLNAEGIEVKEKGFETLGPTIGGESRSNALKAVGIAIVAITLYIAFAFRHVSRPVSSWKFGVSAIVALIHDVLIVLGVFSILGHFAGVEVDTLFITAVLTIMGFSVHDTIVVFDRIRENLTKNVRHLSFDEVVNNSFNETLARSLNTSITVVLVLLALLLFGGESTRWFIVAFMVGIIVGTYSSIFIASAILVEWYKLDEKGFKFSQLFKKRKK